MGRPKGSSAWNVDGVFESDLRSGTGKSGLSFLFDLVARHAWFVDPDVAREVPTVFPRTARGSLGKYRTGAERGGISYWENQPAKYAFFAALGSTERDFVNFNVCHVWPGTTGDPRHFTRLANLVVVPRTLWRFTDWNPVEQILQRRAFELYGYRGPRRGPPRRPAFFPLEWRAPLPPGDSGAVVRRLRMLRAESPSFKNLQGRPRPSSEQPEAEHREGLWGSLEGRPNFEPRREGAKRAGARDLDGEAWRVWEAEPSTTAAFVSWVVRHSYFADIRVARAVENPFPKCRRVRLKAGERHGQVVGGITLAPNIAAADSLLMAIQKPIRSSLGGNVDHPWSGAAQLPAHFCNLRGLVLIPAALSSLVDAEPIRAILKRHMFERTGYGGPLDEEPATPTGYPSSWPETVVLTAKQQERAIRMLGRYRRDRPGYYRARGARSAGRR